MLEFCIFTKDMMIHVPYIDDQHKSLVNFLNKAVEISHSNPRKAQVEKELEFLGDYVVKHFNDEELLQIKSKYPGYKEHKEMHEQFVKTFQNLILSYIKEDLCPQELSEILVKKVAAWVINHVKKEDVLFGKYLKSKGLDFIHP